MRRTERLFAITEHLRARRTGTTAEALAQRFGITIRTVFRDLASLREAGLPVRADRGRGGGVALDRAYTLPPVNLTPREAAVLDSAGRWLIEMRIVPFTATLEAALDKIRGALSQSAQRELIARLETLSYVGVPGRPVAPAVRAAVEVAFFEDRPLLISYLGADGVSTERQIRIDRVIMERGETLINARDLDKGAQRQFKLDRITRARITELSPA